MSEQAAGQRRRIVEDRTQPREDDQARDEPNRQYATSAVRNTPARKTQVVTARQPPTSDVGLSHDPTASPYPLAGTRPEATAPATVPRKKGVISDEPAKIAPNNRACAIVAEYLRNAKLAPRNTIPANASIIGMNSVVIAAANALGKPVHQITRM